MIKKRVFIGLVWSLAVVAHAQEKVRGTQNQAIEPEEIALEQNEFRNKFYEALQQKAIENHDKAIVALQRCAQLQPQNAVVYFELGRNYFALKDYPQALSNYEKAHQLKPDHVWSLVGMYDVLYEQKSFVSAIPVVEKIAAVKPDYREDLVSLYMNVGESEKALALINHLNENIGRSERRDMYKARLLQQPENQNDEIESLKQQLKENPTSEEPYIALMFLYWSQDQDVKAMETAKLLAAQFPESDWANISMYKYNMEQGNIAEATKSFHLILSSTRVDDKIRHRVFNEYLIFAAKNPAFLAEIKKALVYFQHDDKVKVAKEVGKFFHQKNNWGAAFEFYATHIKNEPSDNESMLLLAEVAFKGGYYQELLRLTPNWLEAFPLEPQLYLIEGNAYLQTKNYTKAVSTLETGLDYVIYDQALEYRFCMALASAYEALGQTAKKELYAKRAARLKK